MARVPRYNQGPLASERVGTPGVDRSAGMMADAVMQSNKTIADIGMQAANVIAQGQMDAANTSANSIHRQASAQYAMDQQRMNYAAAAAQEANNAQRARQANAFAGIGDQIQYAQAVQRTTEARIQRENDESDAKINAGWFNTLNRELLHSIMDETQAEGYLDAPEIYKERIEQRVDAFKKENPMTIGALRKWEEHVQTMIPLGVEAMLDYRRQQSTKVAKAKLNLTADQLVTRAGDKQKVPDITTLVQQLSEFAALESEFRKYNIGDEGTLKMREAERKAAKAWLLTAARSNPTNEDGVPGEAIQALKMKDKNGNDLFNFLLPEDIKAVKEADEVASKDQIAKIKEKREAVNNNFRMQVSHLESSILYGKSPGQTWEQILTATYDTVSPKQLWDQAVALEKRYELLPDKDKDPAVYAKIVSLKETAHNKSTSAGKAIQSALNEQVQSERQKIQDAQAMDDRLWTLQRREITKQNDVEAAINKEREKRKQILNDHLYSEQGAKIQAAQRLQLGKFIAEAKKVIDPKTGEMRSRPAIDVAALKQLGEDVDASYREGYISQEDYNKKTFALMKLNAMMDTTNQEKPGPWLNTATQAFNGASNEFHNHLRGMLGVNYRISQEAAVNDQVDIWTSKIIEEQYKGKEITPQMYEAAKQIAQGKVNALIVADPKLLPKPTPPQAKPTKVIKPDPSIPPPPKGSGLVIPPAPYIPLIDPKTGQVIPGYQNYVPKQ